MNIIYILSVFYLMILFLLYKKVDKKICLVSSLIYVIGLVFCYNTFVSFLIYLLGIKGSLVLYSIINYFIGTIILIIIFVNNRKIQKYYIDKKKIITILCVGIIVFLIGSFRFRGFDVISYESGDAAIHYRHALKFSEELSILDKVNSKDYIFNHFFRVMPISYVNCGFLFNIFSSVKTYTLFAYYNVFCLVLCSLIFLVTILDLFKNKKKDYIYALFLTLFYILAYPFNSFIMGFCYLGLNIMVINLLYLTFIHCRNDLTNNIVFKSIIIFLLTFSCFYSYYLFVPVVYLCLGIYYLLLWRKKEINFKQTCIYGIITLIIPFIMGFCHFLITLFIDEGVGSVAKLIGSWGYSYNNITPIYLFIFVSGYFIYGLFRKKKNNDSKISIYVISIYILLFLILYILRISDSYYFYKLFSLYWLLIVLFFAQKIIKFKGVFYTLFAIVLIVNLYIYNDSSSKLANFIINSNIYSWNTVTLGDNNIIFNKDEVEIMDKSIDYQNECMIEDDYKFLILGDVLKNIWFYSVTDAVPVLGDTRGNVHNLYLNLVPNLDTWNDYLLEHKCLIYYYEDEKVKLDESMYEILYSNDSGAIIKRKN